MTSVSTPDLVIAACRNGVVGAFPTHNAPSTSVLHEWLVRMRDELGPADAPVAPNLVVHPSNSRRDADLACLVGHHAELVITSVGSPEPVIRPLHDVGAQVYADVASLAHAQRAVDSGADGLVLLTAGAGGQTGWANPFAFVRAVRERFDGPLVLAGGISDGHAIVAAQALGVDLVYLGTRFIATHESGAEDGYRQAVVASTLDDVRLSDRVGGIPASLLRAWLDAEQASETAETAGFRQEQLLSNRTAWSAGHSVSGVHEISSVAAVIAALAADYETARTTMRIVIDD
ncbi:nitronate monooxygenase [Mycobacterium timonense]|uniref:2-nitropropane dioxygenase n=2 Tax=Mycobacterium avium complex (MAC) TaxID=120793 RepID=A0AAW5S5J1_MYCBC|nr:MULTISPECIES: nitronate monooxygenase [Mycobacterium avium complex (MAC)]MCV6990760.1 nitronate monooxygenase [Mycobacterium bouchedurhonense]MCV6997306.1 nitronate monooxygenase [Mycobacterium timonense]ORA42322.1 2-nitropropane dioxygenase [Mycobacterium bouchedurhonense]ORB76888.1 2-nitropropane dioxygenase [Mycobacterium timonense]